MNLKILNKQVLIKWISLHQLDHTVKWVKRYKYLSKTTIICFRVSRIRSRLIMLYPSQIKIQKFLKRWL